MLISDILRPKGSDVVKIQTTDSVTFAVSKLAEHRIAALVVEDQWMKPAGIFTERDFVNAIVRDGAAVLALAAQQLISMPIISCRSSDRVDAVLATMTTARIRHLPVIEDRQLKGIVSIGDLVKHRLDEKELEASVRLEISRMRARRAGTINSREREVREMLRDAISQSSLQGVAQSEVHIALWNCTAISEQQLKPDRIHPRPGRMSHAWPLEMLHTRLASQDANGLAPMCERGRI